MKNNKKILLIPIVLGLLALNGCSGLGFFKKDNTPPPAKLVTFNPEIRVQSEWNKRTTGGTSKSYLKLVPAVTDTKVYTADKNGTVTATDRLTGKKRWSMRASETISAGPSTTTQHVIVVAKDGTVTAVNQADGLISWKANVESEVLAPPAAKDDIVIIKSVNGKLTALSDQDGHELWKYHQNEPSLILRGGSAPQIQYGNIYAGFANGNLSKLTLDNGSLQWQASVALPEGGFAIQRMIDIDADPLIYGDHVYVATYQGRIAAIQTATGRENWMHDLSSYTGMAIDDDSVFISDAQSHLIAFNRENGDITWRQTQLEARNITAPALMGNYIVVGDGQGYLHWLSKSDGHFVARTRVNKTPIVAAPVIFAKTLYVVTTDGHLATYTIV